MEVDALEKLESFRLGDVGYMPFYRVIPYTYGFGLPVDIGYFSEEWSELCSSPAEAISFFGLTKPIYYLYWRRLMMRPHPKGWDDGTYVPSIEAVPLFLLGRWYDYPLQRKVLARVPVSVVSEESPPGMIETYDDGFHIYADMDFFQYYESTRERVSNDYWLGEQSGVIVYVEIAFRGINATGIRRGQKIIVVREIMLKGEV